MYQKEIIYMGLYKDGSRLRNAGFLRVEKRNQSGSLSLQIQNVPHSVSGRFPVRYYSGTEWKEVDGITLQEGGGRWEKQEEDSLAQVQMQIMLPGGYLVEGASRTVQEKQITQEKQAVQEIQTAQENQTVQKNQTVQENQTAEDSVRTKQMVAEENTRAKRSEKIEYIAVQKQQQAEPPLMADELMVTGLKEDKWEQILDTYDKIHPYGDERIYVKLAPKDFLILSSKYQHLVNNSFLLHGFYNYRHVILGKEGEYYLGVPGVFYEREKMVALMFGFEAFECETSDPKAGTFGYYLRKVEL